MSYSDLKAFVELKNTVKPDDRLISWFGRQSRLLLNETISYYLIRCHWLVYHRSPIYCTTRPPDRDSENRGHVQKVASCSGRRHVVYRQRRRPVSDVAARRFSPPLHVVDIADAVVEIDVLVLRISSSIDSVSTTWRGFINHTFCRQDRRRRGDHVSRIVDRKT